MSSRIVSKNDRGSKNWFVKVCEGNNEKTGTTGCFTRLWGLDPKGITYDLMQTQICYCMAFKKLFLVVDG
ncbi:hypothetical protein APICC_02468 [Apis cerana cerana]|uniref:Uncharacterized protein n=1 Tax=Apis cerana cerana TaxID=94128 RepID=A0A2A3EHX4_APICC|nr:hypothetical protein APICC_02468 [Apis cerana cerana]